MRCPRLRALLPLFVAAFAVVPACKCSPDGPVGATPPAASASASVAASASGSAAPDEDEVRPVYPLLAGPPDPRAVALCAVVHTAVDDRARACCGRSPGKSGLERECERVLTGALASKAVVIADDRVAACTKAIEETFAGCDWIRPLSTPPLPPTCTSLLDGTVAERARCRSHLECSPGLYCDGLSPTRTGTCAKPRQAGSCYGGTDSLAALTRQRADDRHSACDGVCVGRTCSAPVGPGGKCKVSAECGKGNHCEGGKCTAGAAAECEDCPFGTTCLDGSCKPHRKAGERCTKNDECRGMCVKAKGAKDGTCGKQCDLALPGSK